MTTIAKSIPNLERTLEESRMWHGMEKRQNILQAMYDTIMLECHVVNGEFGPGVQKHVIDNVFRTAGLEIE